MAKTRDSDVSKLKTTITRIGKLPATWRSCVTLEQLPVEISFFLGLDVAYPVQ